MSNAENAPARPATVCGYCNESIRLVRPPRRNPVWVHVHSGAVYCNLYNPTNCAIPAFNPATLKEYR